MTRPSTTKPRATWTRHCVARAPTASTCTSTTRRDRSRTLCRETWLGARIVICGTASYPSWNPWNTGPRPERHLLVKRARMQGFLATDFMNRFPEAEARISEWIREGRVNYREDMHEGLEHAPNTGKFVIRLPAART